MTEPDQLSMFAAEEPIEEGMFCYRRPNKGDLDYDQWLRCGVLYFRAGIRNGREGNEDLYAECRAHADDLHCALVAMELAEKMLGA